MPAVLAPSLPNIKGTYTCAYLGTYNGSLVHTTGPFYDAYNDSGITKVTGTVNPGGNSNIIGFNANRSNSIYGSGDTVQPPALQLIPQIKF